MGRAAKNLKRTMFLIIILTVLFGKTLITWAAAGEITEKSGRSRGFHRSAVVTASDDNMVRELVDQAKEILTDIWENVGKEDAQEESEQIFIDQQLKARIFVVVVLVAVGFLFVSLFISFLRAPWKEKLRRIFTLVLAVAILVGLVVIGLRLT